MSLYKEFSSLFPYLQSVRKLKNYLSFDVSFPDSWKLPKKYVEEDKILQQESQNVGEKLFSFVSEFNEFFSYTAHLLCYALLSGLRPSLYN
jgi:hypothetical protein